MVLSRGLSQLLSLLSQCVCWAVVIIFTLTLLQHQEDGFYLYTVIGLQASLLVVTVLAREVAAKDRLICWSLQTLTDPVLCCLSLTPLVLVDKLPGIAYTRGCLDTLLQEGRTDLSCLNHTLVRPLGTWANSLVFQGDITNHRDMLHVLDIQLVILGLTLLLPPIMGLLYYKPWLPWKHHVLGGIFWTLQALDASALLQTVTSDPEVHPAVAMSALSRGVLLILGTGFVLSTPLLLVSLLQDRRGRPLDLLDVSDATRNLYGDLYVKFAVVLDLTLWELPDLAAKCLILSRAHDVILPTSFYCSLIKNIVIIALLSGCVVKLFNLCSVSNPGEHTVTKPEVPPEFREPIANDHRSPITVMVDIDGRMTSDQNSITSSLESVTSGDNRKWERLLVMYGLISCFILIGCMIGAVCFYGV